MLIALIPPVATCACGWRCESPDPHRLREAGAAHLESHRGETAGWAIQVWNRQTRLVRVLPGEGDRLVEVDLRRFSPSLRQRIRTLVLESVRQAGGNPARSGYYPPLPALRDLLRMVPLPQERTRLVQVALYPEDVAFLERLQTALGVPERSWAIRMAVRLALQALSASSPPAPGRPVTGEEETDAAHS